MRTIRYLVPAWLAMVCLASAQDFGALSSCAQNCVNNMRTSVGCVPVTDQCLCDNAGFENGIRDCANQACSPEDAAAAVDYAGGFCLKATGTTTAAAATTPETTNTPPPPATTTAGPETTATTPTTATEPTSVSAESVTSATETPTASTATAETSSTASTTASETSETSSASSTSTSTSETSETTGTKTSVSQSASSTASAAAAPGSDSGLSVGAKAGIAVGAGAAVVALVALAVAYCRTRHSRRPLPRGTMQISEPLPGSGRLGYEDHSQFSPPPPKSAGSKFSGMTELDMNARRYEDMLPRVSPRKMV